MSESFIVTGKTLEAAVAEAKKQYGDGITYDIIQMNKGGFLGIGAKEAMIKVTVEGHDDVLGSIVKEIKGYKSQTAPKTGYYEDDEKPAPEERRKAAESAEARKARSRTEGRARRGSDGRGCRPRRARQKVRGKRGRDELRHRIHQHGH
ncbi:MAG: Jag N-terminal domain-containing protein [Clostridia bacterium]|nr:Jag N-terminal domain-containing protein [Clostridia bacterium]